MNSAKRGACFTTLFRVRKSFQLKFWTLNICTIFEWLVFSESYTISFVGECSYFVIIASLADLERMFLEWPSSFRETILLTFYCVSCSSVYSDARAQVTAALSLCGGAFQVLPVMVDF